MGTARVRNRASIRTYNTTSRLLDGSGAVQSASGDTINLYDYGYSEDECNEMALMGVSPYDIGGSFLCLKAEHDFPDASRKLWADNFGLRWDISGNIIALPSYAIMGPDYNSVWKGTSGNALDSQLVRIGLGATAISRCRPAKPQASLSVTLIEAYREGIPNTLKQFSHMKDEVAKFRELSHSAKAKEVGPSKYLEYQFGWKPLVSDIQKTTRALIQWERILEDLRKNSGKRMRRRYTFPTVESTTEVVRDGARPWPNPNAYILQQAGPRVIVLKSTKKTWFSGEFIYTYPTVDAPFPSRMRAGARQLLGLDLTPETIWNVAPWTWLSDWFANVGDVIANMTAIGEDHLVMRYGYLMQEAIQEYEHTHYGVTAAGGSIPENVRGRTVFTAKSRIVASPFGFGLTFDSLSPRQVAILTSIGITRRGRH